MFGPWVEIFIGKSLIVISYREIEIRIQTSIVWHPLRERG